MNYYIFKPKPITTMWFQSLDEDGLSWVGDFSKAKPFLHEEEAIAVAKEVAKADISEPVYLAYISPVSELEI